MHHSASSRFRTLVSTLLCCLAVIGCQSIVRSDVSTFRSEETALGEGSIYVKPGNKEATESLEFRFYRDKLAKRLQRAGYTLAEKGAAQYEATLNYGVIRQEKDKPDTRVVVGGFWGYYPHYPRGSMLITDASGAEFEFVREVNLRIDRIVSGDAREPVLEVKAASIGHCEHLTVVYDEMLEAIFSDLKRPNGSVVKVAVEGEARCP